MRGLEPDRVTSGGEKDLRESHNPRAAESDALRAECGLGGAVGAVEGKTRVGSTVARAHEAADSGSYRSANAELAVVTDAWPRLPEVVRAGILAMVQAAGGADA